ncbi:MAG TPA: GNAT family N-acetyltransferase [Actinomycetota bacterium]|nr:GNAT family N-acetyltransferase [Actinomycetota bacterium]
MQLSFRPMRSAEWAPFEEALRRGYAEELSGLAGYDAASAARRANEEHAKLLPDGQESTGQHFFVIEDGAGQSVGTIWFAEQEEYGTRYAYLYDIHIDEGRRAQGVGTAAMAALEAEAARRGLSWIDLNVSGTNDVARGLYRKLGYQETFVRMRKPLD